MNRLLDDSDSDNEEDEDGEGDGDDDEFLTLNMALKKMINFLTNMLILMLN